MPIVPETVARRLHEAARAERWDVPLAVFASALERSASKIGGAADASALERHLGALHLEDLALASACAAGHERAWEHFIETYRLPLHRAADALDPSGGAREAADALYGELYGVRGGSGARRSLFDYFHGRSSLATWLRAILAQRHVDQIRNRRRTDPLPDDDEAASALAPPVASASPDRGRFVALIRTVMGAAIAALAAADRLRLGCYYGQQMTLAQIGATLGEHEATVSRHLTRTRRQLRDEVVRRLRDEHGLGDVAVDECLSTVAEDSGPLDLRDWLAPGAPRKVLAFGRSKGEDES